MECRIVPDPLTGKPNKVKAPNGAPSILFEHIKKAMPDNYQPDLFVLAYYQQGEIKGFSKEEIAEALYTKYNALVEDGIIQTDETRTDQNGEALFSEIHEAIGLPELSDNYFLSGEKAAEVFINDLETKGLIERQGDGYRLSEKATIQNDGRRGIEQNLFQVNQKLNWLGIPKDFVSFVEKDGKTTIEFHPDKFIVTQKIGDYHSQVNTRFLIGYLGERFPQLQFHFVTEKEAKEVYSQLPELSSRTPFEKVNSFVHQGQVYLIEGRVTSEIAIEETLHPFIYTIAKTNKELFDQLHKAAQDDFPRLEKQINRRYTAKNGFTEEDRRLELVTQALSQVYSKEFKGNAPQSIRSVLPKLVQWLLDLVKQVGEVLSGKTIKINPRDLSSNTPLSQLAKALNTFDSEFLIDADSMNASFSLSSEKEAFRRRINAQANPLQREVIDDFFRPKNPVVFDPQQKAYLTGRKALYSSLNTDISGSKKDAEGSEGLRKLFGKKARHVLELMALGERFEDIKDRIEGVSPAVASRAYKTLQQQLRQLVSSDSIIMPRMVIADHANKTASTLDFLVLDKDGGLTVINLKVSDTSYHDKQKYEQEQNKVGSASKLKGDSLSLHLEHGIKTAANWQMLRNNGYNVEDVYTLHIHLPKEKDQYILQVENLQRHKPTENRGWVKKILPVVSTPVDKIEQFKNGLGQGNPTRQPDFLSEEDRMPEEEPEEPVDHLTIDHEKLAQGRKSLANEVEELVKSVHSHPKSVMVQKLSELMKFVQHDLSKGEVTAAYGRFLRTSLEEVEKIMNYLSDETKIVGDPEFARIAIEAGWFIASYQGIGQAFKLHIGNQHHTGKLDELIGMLTTLDHKILSSLKKYIQYQVKTVSQKELTAKDLEKIVDEAIDISKADYLFGDMATSRDTLLAVADKIYKRQIIAAKNEMVAFDEKVKAAANEYFKVSGGDNEMDKLIEDGTGRIVMEIGPQYHNLRDSLEAKTRTAEGVVKRYREVDSLADADPADLAHNKDVYKNKKALREFMEPEKQSETGVEDGMYHAYNTEFKIEREKVEEYKALYDENNKFIRGVWVKKQGVSDAVYQQFKRKYYQEVVFDKAVLQDGEFTGMVLKNGGKEWFVKEEYIEIRKVAGDGTDMVSAKWRALQEYAATSEKGEALLKFFKFYTDAMQETLQMLPPNVYKDMMGKLARIQGNLIQRISKSPNRFKAAAKTVGDWFNMNVYAKSGMYNDDGTVMNQIPIFFVGNLRNEELVEQLGKELDQLDQDYKDKKIERLRYLQERGEKAAELKAAERAISHDEINTDLVENLIAFRAMAENYRHLNAIEGTVNAVERILAQRSYKKMAGQDKLKMDLGKNKPYELEKGTESYTYKRFKKWTEMVFYNSQDLDQSTFDVVAKKLMSFTSLESVGFNSFGAIHNYLMARINTIIESAGGTFYTRDSAWRAFKAFEMEFLPGRFRSSGGGDEHYKNRRAGSKYEALVKLFHIHRQTQSGDNRINFPTLGFPLMEAGEYSAQTKSGIAYLMSHDLTNAFTNETVSIYDAYDFNVETGELTLRAGFNIDPTIQLDITNSIWEMNKQIHGNYDWMDRMVIQQETVGQVAAQFHKWVYPAYKTYFQSRYFDENLGWLEGRFRTVYNLIRYIHQSEGSFLQKITAGWKQLDDVQLKNMYKNAASLGFFIASFAAYGLFRSLAGDTPDDKKATKRWLNFFSWESDRVYKEVAFWAPGAVIGEQIRLIKNPFAIGTTMSQFTGMLAEGFKLALPPYDNDVYYKHGPFEGELKFKKKLFDLLPVMKDINKWQSFSQVTNFQVQ